ncbi:MAG: hypothetical protein WAU32_14780, partial [Thermoanaerobaculia bacterium]
LPAWAAACLAAGIALWVAVAWSGASVPEPAEPFVPDSAAGRRLAVGLPLAAVLTGFAFWQMRDANFHAAGTICWIAALAVWFWTWTPRPASRRPEPRRDPTRQRRIALILFLAVLAIGVFFRFYRLSELPAHPHSDHVEDLFNIEDLDAGQRPVFFERNTGQAPLPFYWIWLLHRLFGLPLHFTLLKVSLALIGLLVVPATYVLGRTLGGWRLGLFAAAFAAWSMWATLGARRGLSYPFAVFPAALALAGLIAWMRTGQRRHALLAGLWLGVGQHGYNAFKIAPLLVPLAMLLALTDGRWKGRRLRIFGDALLMAGTALIVFLPLLDYAVKEPQWFFHRILTRVTGEERSLAAPALVLFGRNLKNMALAFHWKGDGGWIHAVIDEPFLDPATGAFLLAGIVLGFALWLRGSRAWGLVLLSLPVWTLASSLNLAFPHENPGITRSAVALPSIMALCALPAAWIAGEAVRLRSWRRLAPAAALAVLLGLSLSENVVGYFGRFGRQMTMLLDPVMEMVSVARAYRDRGVPFDRLYLLDWPHWVDARCIAYELDIPKPLQWAEANNVWPGVAVARREERPLLYFFQGHDEERRRQLRELYPGGEERVWRQANPDRDWISYYVSR